MGKQESKAMKNFVILSLASLVFLQSAVEAIFLGPIAVGAVIGAIAVKRGFLLGSLLSQRRTRTQNYRQPRTYTRYNRRNHYHQQDAYYEHYTKRQTYYYSSDDYSYRGKRFAPEIDMAELERYKREVDGKLMADEWYMDMVEKDQDDCTKRLICEVSHKKASGKTLNSIEEGIMEIFGTEESVDASRPEGIFDFAAQAGKYWKLGGVGCEFYRRCDPPVVDILAMMETELDDFEQLEQFLEGDESKAEQKMSDEKNQVQDSLQSLDSDIVLV